MKRWMLPWLLPLVLIVGVVLVILFRRQETLAGAVAAVLLIPVLWRLHHPTDREDRDTNYWRLPRL